MTNADQNQSATPEQEIIRRLQRIFLPHAAEKAHNFYEPTGGSYARFVHYTSADAALKIINSKRIWMRNTKCMSDYSEVEHGYAILRTFFSENNNRANFLEAIEECAPGVARRAITLFDEWWPDTLLNTYIAAVSEHVKEEDLHGRLSMWRAFGGNVARVAIVINIPWLSEGTEALKIQFIPVAYLNEDGANNELRTIINNVHNDADFLRSVDPNIIFNWVFQMLVLNVVCLKHEGFHEEREWRVIYAPNRLPSPLMPPSAETIVGIPQTVYKIPIDNSVAGIPDDLDLSNLFDRLIIGPSPYSWPMREAFITALTEAGIAEAGNRVFISGIPIRT